MVECAQFGFYGVLGERGSRVHGISQQGGSISGAPGNEQ